MHEKCFYFSDTIKKGKYSKKDTPKRHILYIFIIKFVNIGLKLTKIVFKRLFVIRYITCRFSQKTSLKTNLNGIFIEHIFIFYIQMQKDIFYIKSLEKYEQKNRDTQKIIVHLFYLNKLE